MRFCVGGMVGPTAVGTGEISPSLFLFFFDAPSLFVVGRDVDGQ